jgi:hypothetical protein
LISPAEGGGAQKRDALDDASRNAREKRYFTGDAHIELISNPVRGE